MKHLALSASAVALTLASATAAAWWANPYYAAPYVAPTPQQMHQMAEHQRDAAIKMMDAQREAMEANRPARPELPAFLSDYSMPEPPRFGQRPEMPQMPEMPEMPAFGPMGGFPTTPFLGDRPAMPEMPSIPELPEFAMPEMPAVPDFGDLPKVPDSLLDPDQRKAEREAYRSALQQQSAERRAAMQAVSEQRRALSEQRRLDWLCSRQAMRPLPHARMSKDCVAAPPALDAEPAAAKPAAEAVESAPVETPAG